MKTDIEIVQASTIVEETAIRESGKTFVVFVVGGGGGGRGGGGLGGGGGVGGGIIQRA